jgi:hypothetical protein
MLTPKFGRLIASLFVMGAAQTVSVAPAHADPTPSQCVQYSIYVCQTEPGWSALGYSSYGACRLQEYANCMAGVPPYPPVELKRSEQPATAPGTTVNG